MWEKVDNELLNKIEKGDFLCKCKKDEEGKTSNPNIDNTSCNEYEVTKYDAESDEFDLKAFPEITEVIGMSLHVGNLKKTKTSFLNGKWWFKKQSKI